LTEENSFLYLIAKCRSYKILFIQIADAIENEKAVSKTIKIYNVDRSACGRIAGVIAKKYGDTGFAGQLNIT
jgi:glutamate synthase domain-containing protein 3